MMRRGWMAGACAVACLLAACAAAEGSLSPSSSGALPAVSLSKPATPEAAEAVGLCVLTDHLGQVAGMAEIDHGYDVPKYAPLTGAEPEIQTDSPVWVVRYSGVIRLSVRGQAASSAFVDAETPTCIVVDGVSSWLMTGTTTAQDGTKVTPLPATQSLLPLPTLAP